MNSISRTVYRTLQIARNWNIAARHIAYTTNPLDNAILPNTKLSVAFRNDCLLRIPNLPGCCSCRHYAKTKDKKKEKGKTKVQINETQLAEAVDVESLRKGMQKSVDRLKEDFVKNLSLRSTTGSIETLKINLDGKEHTIQEVAQVVRKNPKILVINMAVFPQAIPAVLKAIQKSGMNLNPQQDGTTLYVPVPKVTKELRENLAKNAKQLFVTCKNSIRDVQIKHVKAVKKKEKSEDMARSVEQQIIAMADGYIEEADKILKAKQIELVGNE